MSAKSIAKFCGGRKALAIKLKVSLKTVNNWCRSKETGGTGDVVPEKYREDILAAFPGLSYENFRPLMEVADE